MWTQPYQYFGQGAVVSALVAAIPILVVLLALGVLRTTPLRAAVCGLATSVLIATLPGHMPVKLTLGAASYGAAFGLFPIMWIVFAAIALFRLCVETGRFALIRQSIGALADDPVRQALLIAFGFEAFLEGAAGFGTPVAIAAAMLTGLGFSPLRAATICLLANTAPVAFGSLGIPLLTLGGTTGLPLHALSMSVAVLCAPLAILLPAYTLSAVGGHRVLRTAWLPALMSGCIFAGVQCFICRYFGPQLADILAALVSVLSLICLFRFSPTSELTEDDAKDFRGTEQRIEPNTDYDAVGLIPRSELMRAWSPYIFLVAFVLLWNVPIVRLHLERSNLTAAWPLLNNAVLRGLPFFTTPQPYPATFLFNPAAAAGTACMAAVLVTAIASGFGFIAFGRLVWAVCRQLTTPTLTVVCVMAMAFVMNYSGQTATLGIALARSHAWFPILGAFIGWLGVFLTGSDTSSNALFGSLQVATAVRLNLNPVLMAAVNSTGGVLGKMISLQTITVAAAATGLSSHHQSRLFRSTLKHSLLLTLFAGVIALLYVRLH